MIKVGDKVRLKKNIDPANLRGLIDMGFKVDATYTIAHVNGHVYAFHELWWQLSDMWIELVNQKSVGFIIE